jgi:hypothetical protein
MNKRLKTGTKTFILAMLLVLSGLFGNVLTQAANTTGKSNPSALVLSDARISLTRIKIQSL